MQGIANLTNPEQLNNPQKGVGLTLNNVFVKCVIIMSFICQMLVLYNRSIFESVTGPILALCIVILTFTDYYYIPFAIVLLTPHAIGTVIMGRISFYVFMGAILALRLLIIKFDIVFTLSNVLWLMLGLFNVLHLNIFMFEHVGSEKLTYMAIFTAWIVFLFADKRRDSEIVDKFFLTFGIAIVTNATVSLISRTATKYVASDRLGIIGIGASDPNIAAMMLTLAVAIIIGSKYLKVWLKIVLVLIPMLSMITTVSVSGVLAIVILFLIFGIAMNKSGDNLSVFFLIILGALIAVYIFPMLGIMGEENAAGETTNYLEYYQDKIYNRVGAFFADDIDAASSGRTALMQKNMEFLREQSAIKQLFGGNHVNPLGINVSHNTFADIALRFGYVGLFAVIIMIIFSLIKCVQRLKESGNCTVLLCKAMMLYWSLTLSIFDGSVGVLWFTIVLML